MTQHQATALVTGGAKRIGQHICQALHAEGYNILLHYRSSETEAKNLADALNKQRPQSCTLVQAELCDKNSVQALIQTAQLHQVNLLVNNASSFYPTALNEASYDDWDDLFNSNVKAAYFLSQGLLDCLKAQQGSIINIVDIHSEKPIKQYSIYCMAKAALNMMTKALAKDLAPDVRVNGVSPGAILWPELDDFADDEKALQADIRARIPMKRIGAPEDISQAVVYLSKAKYVTGEILHVDGGRRLSM